MEIFPKSKQEVKIRSGVSENKILSISEQQVFDLLLNSTILHQIY